MKKIRSVFISWTLWKETGFDKKAINFPYEQPNFAKKFKHNIKFKTLSLKEKTDNFIYDIKCLPRYLIRKMKKKFNRVN